VTPVVLDASVAAKWFLPAEGEPLAQEALVILQAYSAGNVRLIVPDLFWAEVGNLLWKAIRQGRCTKTVADSGLTSLRELNLPTTPSVELIGAAFEIALAYDRTVYDSLYVALAVQSQGQFVTADERLANAVAARLPVKWLGAA
jgi:predicted nucleic acid-binding protein